ncbi:nucleoside phosphorylase [Desulfomicrobium salsuginis]
MTNETPEPGPTSLRPTGPFSEADLPIDADGCIYHLQLKPEQLAPDILLVGDPGRAEFIGSYLLREVEIAREHRGLITVTGTAEITGARTTVISPLRTTVATSGMGTPSLEIVLNELVALHEIDFATRRRKDSFPTLNVIRVGTSGALQASTKLGTPIVTSYAVGMDNTGLFYEAPCPDDTCARLERELTAAVREAMPEGSRFRGHVRPYVSRAEPAVCEALAQAATSLGLPARRGLTVSNSGFFAPQGRDVSRLRPSVPELDRLFSDFDPRLGGQRMENMEMETSFLCHFLGALGHRAGAICPALANRRTQTFDHDYLDAVENATRIALLALANLRASCPGAG